MQQTVVIDGSKGVSVMQAGRNVSIVTGDIEDSDVRISGGGDGIVIIQSCKTKDKLDEATKQAELWKKRVEELQKHKEG